VIYLTFDDGPIVPYTRQILDVLAANEATATFFVVGAMVTRNPQLISQIKQGGHAIGNHTWTHTAMTTQSDAQIRSELTRTTEAVGKENMGACMRPPYGDRNERTIATSRQEGYKTVVWTHWAVDWEQPPVPELVASLKAASEDRANILLHDGGGDRPNTVAALKIMLPKWRKQGFTFAAVPACARPLT
jgi:peptidoglycan/xylan/chitin deacetylase (PgdA/CDA1 family)